MPSATITGGITASKLAIPATTATPDYSDGDTVGGKLTFELGTRQTSGGVTRIAIRSAVAIAVDSFLHLFNADPSASTFTDNSAISIHADDKNKLFESVKIASADWVSKGAGLYRMEKALWLPFEMGAGNPGNLYAALETDGTINLGAVDDLAVWLSAELNQG